ncbi:bifunctional 3-(3-hydroxy-phenyl)propionate/3-hydroxycinnamic acid hydroxylase [Amycolatopsis sp. cmx-4-61]|uniref:bifunctional 3-(3-hydroxy-phenyl)propionate/3-hydroxycinnamic acid hydroxylase n=1 Tax=Amycolatopsis sp. cmx-4-61 TaxID=2790937 RepID=UPI00397CB28E
MGVNLDEVDVVVIGYGPTGMTTAALLGRAGHRVTVLERYSGLYNLPRAASFDDETMRTFARLGIADRLLPTVHAQPTYEWRNGAGDLLIEHAYAAEGRSGWAEWYMMYQPDLEDALHEVCRSTPGVEIRLGAAVTGIDQAGEQVVVTTADGSRVRARFVVACDGGNSFVREALAIGQDDYGFAEPWMVCDFRLNRPAEAIGLPRALQLGDPRHPTSIISLGPRHHRFSFMLEAGETTEDAAAVWTRVADRLTPADAELIRVATYTFRSLVAHQWRAGRVLLAGDAAHQMPPFLGQGMCSGVRDARNVAFKLDLVLRGAVEDTVLDTYQSEREPHVRAVIEKGVELGRAQTIRDPELAAERDRTLLARRAAAEKPESLRLPGLGDGLVVDGGGELSVQGRVDDGTRVELLDRIVGGGFHLLVAEEALAELDRAALDAAGIRVVAFGDRPGGAVVADVDGTYRRWFAELGATAIAVRPDFYVFGAGTDPKGLAGELLAAVAPVPGAAGGFV